MVTDEPLLRHAVRSTELRSFQEGVITAISHGLQEDDACFCESAASRPCGSPRKTSRSAKTAKSTGPQLDLKRPRPASPEPRDGLLPATHTLETSLVSIVGLQRTMDVTSVSVALTRLMECSVFLTPTDLARSFGVIRVPRDFAAAMFPPRTTQRKYIDSADRWEVMIHNCKADGSALHYDPEFDLGIPLSERNSKTPPVKKPKASKNKLNRARGTPAMIAPPPSFLALPPPATLPPPLRPAVSFEMPSPEAKRWN